MEQQSAAKNTLGISRSNHQLIKPTLHVILVLWYNLCGKNIIPNTKIFLQLCNWGFFIALYMKSCEDVIIASFSEQATTMTRQSKTSGSTYGSCCLLISNVLLINLLSKKTIWKLTIYFMAHRVVVHVAFVMIWSVRYR